MSMAAGSPLHVLYTYMEENNIDSEVNRINCMEAVTKYMGKWARATGADI